MMKFITLKSGLIICLLSLFANYVDGQTRLSYWFGQNTSTGTFPLSGNNTEAAITSSSHNYSGLSMVNDNRNVYNNTNSNAMNPNTSYYLSYTMNFPGASIDFDRFVVNAMTGFSNVAEVRWDVDGFSTSLGNLTWDGGSYTLTSVDLSSSSAVTNSVEFRIYFHSGSSWIYMPAGSSYASIDGTPNSYSTYAAVAVWGSMTTLPVQLSYFTASTPKPENVQLEWSTQTEENTQVFNVERSENGVDWETIDQIRAAGNSQTTRTYLMIDENPLIGDSYYRLKIIDFDGDFDYSEIESVSRTETTQNQSLSVYPNPASDEVILTGQVSEIKQIKVMDLTGRDVTNQVQLTPITNEKVRIDLSSLNIGLFMIQTANESVRVYKQ